MILADRFKLADKFRRYRDAVTKLQYLSEPELYRLVGNYSEWAIRLFYRKHPWALNYVLNAYEFISGRTVLATYPPNPTFCITGSCNANCTLVCLSQLWD